jgi:uncharacterized protein (DUF4415 family)
MKTIKKTIDIHAMQPMQQQDLQRLDAIKDKNIDYSDIPELKDDFFKRAKHVSQFRKEKQRITMRLDSDVLEWLKQMGSGYQSRANMILRAAMEHNKPL